MIGDLTDFIVLGKFKEKPTKKGVSKTNEFMKKLADEGVKFKHTYWTLGEYDTIGIFEAPDEKAAMKAMLGVSDIAKTTTLAAVPREEATKLID